MARDAEAFRRYLGGATYREVASQMGWRSSRSAYEACRRAVADEYRLPRDEAIRVEEDRLDLLTAGFTRLMEQPGQDAQVIINAGLALLRVSESRRKLLGLDAPARRAVEVITADVVEAEIVRLEAENRRLELRARNGRPDDAA